MAEKKVTICKDREVIGLGIDLLNGFLLKGKLADVNMRWIIPNIKNLIEYLYEKNCLDVAITADEHEIGDVELERFPPHCMKGTQEAELIRELKKFYPLIIKKKTTNSFVDTKLGEYLVEAKPKAIVVFGVCSDICVLQAVITLSSIADEIELERIIVPKDCVTTFGADAKQKDESAFKILANVPRVEVIESYENLGDVLVIN